MYDRVRERGFEGQGVLCLRPVIRIKVRMVSATEAERRRSECCTMGVARPEMAGRLYASLCSLRLQRIDRETYVCPAFAKGCGRS